MTVCIRQTPICRAAGERGEGSPVGWDGGNGLFPVAGRVVTKCSGWGGGEFLRFSEDGKQRAPARVIWYHEWKENAITFS